MLENVATVTGVVSSLLTVERELVNRWHIANYEPAAQFQQVGRIRENPVNTLQRNITEFFSKKQPPIHEMQSTMSLY